MKKSGIGAPSDAGGNQDVITEAKSASAKVKFKDGGCVEGAKSRMRLDRPGRKTGGRVFGSPLAASSSVAPMTEASKVTSSAKK
jgi:hypothetical protein